MFTDLDNIDLDNIDLDNISLTDLRQLHNDLVKLHEGLVGTLYPPIVYSKILKLRQTYLHRTGDINIPKDWLLIY